MASERDWLREAVQNAEVNTPAPTFVALSVKKYQRGAEKYGEFTYLERPAGENMENAQEEAIDGPNWLHQEVEVLEQEVERGYPERYSRLVADHLQAAATDFFRAWQKIEDAKETYREGLAEAVVPAQPPVSIYFEE